MNESDRKKFAELIGDVHAFYGRDSSKFAVGIWWNAMRPYDFRATEDALGRHCVNPDSGQFMPKPADVVRMLEGSTQDAALVAWSKVDYAMRRVGTNVDVVFDDALIHRVIYDMSGWIGLGMKREDEWPFVAKEFVNRYRGYRMCNKRPDYPLMMIGISGAYNRQMGFEVQPPVFIGDAKQCALVMQGGSDCLLIEITHASDKVLHLLENDLQPQAEAA